VPYIIIFIVENKVNRQLQFEWFHAYMSHGLTLCSLFYNYLNRTAWPREAEHSIDDYKVLQHDLELTL
jgi:hypothetical protein